MRLPLSDRCAWLPAIDDEQLSEPAHRRHFLERLEEELSRTDREHIPLHIAVVDLDHFKSINDTYGHGVGDVLLTQLGMRLRHQMRETDLVARLGGDEFAVILEDLHAEEEVQQIAEKLGLQPEPVSTQIIPRDRHAAFFATLGVVASAQGVLASLTAL